MLGFERKARLFCDFLLEKFPAIYMLGFERKARLFCDEFPESSRPASDLTMLGFERKARLFCDFPGLNSMHADDMTCWDLSGRLGYFVTSF